MVAEAALESRGRDATQQPLLGHCARLPEPGFLSVGHEPICLPLICPTRETGNRTKKGGDILVGPRVMWVMRWG